ncbi:MAG: hypothetical protein JNM07_02180 [Phycisphaerae bacterium]|nr:hypothetical protein [Phycisphaerae bacterium]
MPTPTNVMMFFERPRFRELVFTHDCHHDSEARGFLREAEELIEGNDEK